MVIFDYEGRTTQVFLFYMAVSLKDCMGSPEFTKSMVLRMCYESVYISYHIRHTRAFQPREIKVRLFWRMWTALYLSLELNAVNSYLA